MSRGIFRASRPLSSAGTVVIGLCLGITLSLIFAPFIEEPCDSTESLSSIDFIVLQENQDAVLDSQSEQDLQAKTNVSIDSNHVQESSDNKKIDVDPKEHVQDKPQQDAKIQETVPKRNRPKRLRYASTELGIREKLFVAVMTSRDTVVTLGSALNKTLSTHVTKLIFFTHEKITAAPSGLTVVNFDHIDASAVVLHVLKYISNHYLQTFDYYMFVSDMTYIRGNKLYELVSKVSVSEHVHLGSQNPFTNSKSCSLDGGIILSQSVLAATVTHLSECLKMDVAGISASEMFGQCILNGSSQACSDTVSDKQFTSYHISDLETRGPVSRLRANVKFRTAITISPIPDEMNLYKTHRYFCELEINNTKQEIEKLTSEIVDLSEFAPGGREALSWPIGAPEPFRPKSRFDVIRWDYFTQTQIYFDSDFSNVRDLEGLNRLDVDDVLHVALKYLNEKHNTEYKINKLQNGYRRFDATRGMEYILDLELHSAMDTDSSRETRVHLLRPLGLVEIVPMPYVTENAKINLILPIRETDRDDVKNFLETYAENCLDSGDNTNLFIVFIYKRRSLLDNVVTDDLFSNAKSQISYYENKYQNGAKITWISIQVAESFVSEIVILDGVSKKFSIDSLLLVASIGMDLTSDFLNRVRMNTIMNAQVFFPMAFWEYKPNLIYDEKPYPSTIEINREVGHYDSESYEHSSFYNADFIIARKGLKVGVERTTDLFSMFRQYKNVYVFRAVEPSLRHHYHAFNCTSDMPSRFYKRCLTRRTNGLGTRAQLAKLVFEHQQQLEQAKV